VSEAYEGKQIVGIDLHRRRSVVVRMTESGERLASMFHASDRVIFDLAGGSCWCRFSWWAEVNPGPAVLAGAPDLCLSGWVVRVRAGRRQSGGRGRW
jgi:hypothetical protein